MEAKKTPAFGRKSAAARITRWQRLAIQVVFLIFAPQTFSLAFAGVKQLFVSLGQLEAFQVNSFLILLLLLLAFTVVFGRFFCGYLCAFGTVGDILYQAVDAVFKALKIKRPRIPSAVQAKLKYLKYVVLVFFLATSAAGLSSAVSVYSPWTAFGRFIGLDFLDLNLVGLGLLIVVMLCCIVEERFFCKFLCPMGAVFSLLPVLPRFGFRRHEETCTNCGACQKECPAAIMPPGSGPDMGECFACGRCEHLCAKHCIGQMSAKQLEERMLAAAQGAAEAADAAAVDGTAADGQVPAAPLKQEAPLKQAHTVPVVVKAVAMLVLF